MKARLSTSKVLHFFDSGSEIGGGTFLAKIKDSDGVEAFSLAMTQVTGIPSLYLSEAFIPVEAGKFDVFYTEGETVVFRDTLEIGQPLTDAALDTAVVMSLSAQEAGGNDSTVTLAVLDASGDSIVADGEDDPIPAAYDADYNAYTAEVTFEEEGDYFLVWYKDGVPHVAKSILAIKPYGLENIRFYCATLEGNNGTPHIGTTVVVSKSTGPQVEIGVTDNAGQLDLQVPAGDYVISLVKSGITYSINNFTITVGDSIAESLGPRQVYQVITESFEPTTSAPLSDAAMCTLFASIYKMDGSPLAYAPVHIRMLTKPQLYSGTTVYDSQLYFKTDSNGKVEFQLIQGIQIEVAVPPMGLRRIITVPSGEDAAEPVNLFTLMSEANDLFDIQKPQIQTAPRRTR